MDIKRTLSPESPSHILNQVVGAGYCIYAFAATPYTLVGVNLNKKAAPDITAFYFCNLKICGH
jgi:hypothetical protein